MMHFLVFVHAAFAFANRRLTAPAADRISIEAEDTFDGRSHVASGNILRYSPAYVSKSPKLNQFPPWRDLTFRFEDDASLPSATIRLARPSGDAEAKKIPESHSTTANSNDRPIRMTGQFEEEHLRFEDRLLDNDGPPCWYGCGEDALRHRKFPRNETKKTSNGKRQRLASQREKARRVSHDDRPTIYSNNCLITDEIFPEAVWSLCSHKCKVSCGEEGAPTYSSAKAFVRVDYGWPKNLPTLRDLKKAQGQTWISNDWLESHSYFQEPDARFDFYLSFQPEFRTNAFYCPMFSVDKGLPQWRSTRFHDYAPEGQQSYDPSRVDAIPYPTLAEKNVLVSWIISAKYNTPEHVPHTRYGDRVLDYLKKNASALRTKDINLSGGYMGSPRISVRDARDLVRRSKFYLGLEHAMCGGYLTEKTMRGLIDGAVPVVFGGLSRAEYEAIMPPGSFVSADDFHSPEALAQHLIELDHDDAAYARYFQWHREYNVSVGCHKAACNVCRAAHGVKFDQDRVSPDEAKRKGLIQCRKEAAFLPDDANRSAAG